MEHLQLHYTDSNALLYKRKEYTQLALNTFKYGILEPHRNHLKYFTIKTLEEGLNLCSTYDNKKL